MLCLLSPAKTMRSAADVSLSKSFPDMTATVPALLEKVNILARLMKKKSKQELMKICDVSDNLGTHVKEIFTKMHVPADTTASDSQDSTPYDQAPAGVMYDGPAFKGLNAGELTANQQQGLQSHLRIISGFYGILKPVDMIQEYRLCFDSKMPIQEHKDLYSFWGSSIADTLISELEEQLKSKSLNKEKKKRQGELPLPLIINVASQEYFKGVMKHLPACIAVLDVVFLDGGMVKSAFAKRARGLFARFACTNFISSRSDVEKLKGFNTEGYEFNAAQSTPSKFVFTRSNPPKNPPKNPPQAKPDRSTSSSSSSSLPPNTTSTSTAAGKGKRSISSSSSSSSSSKSEKSEKKPRKGKDTTSSVQGTKEKEEEEEEVKVTVKTEKKVTPPPPQPQPTRKSARIA